MSQPVVPTPLMAPDSLRPLRAFAAHEPTLFAAATLLFAAMLPTAFAALADARLFQGVDVWSKPLKFQFAFGLYACTLVFFARFLSVETRARRWYRVYSVAVALAIVAEAVWTAGAAMLGTASHFNPTMIGQTIYGIMGIAALLLTSASSVYAYQIARNKRTTLAPALKESIVAGLALTLPLTLITVGYPWAENHWIGGELTDANGLAVMGWARDGGDLRVSHFFATHALHVIPVFGLVSIRMFGRDNRLAARLFWLSYAAFVIFTLLQALAGKPFLPFLG